VEIIVPWNQLNYLIKYDVKFFKRFIIIQEMYPGNSMKSLIIKNNGINKGALIFAIIFAAVFMFSLETFAQHRERGMGWHRNVPRHALVRPVPHMQNYARVQVSGRNYFYRDGAFYRRDRFGYHAIIAPIGARIRFLPFGYLMYRLGALNYYYYNGIYYNYLPGEGVYVVVQKPANINNPENLKLDQIKLYDGSILNGVFQGATDSTVTLRMNDQDRVINIGDIISINFAPTISDSTEQK
jgi:Family of unknown function (DUF6515)